VGQNAWEEIDYEPAGAGGRNYGWRNREGAHDNVTTQPPFSQPLIDPIFELPRSQARSITGGFVYRGTRLGSAYVGRYFFGDFATSRIWSLTLSINPQTRDATVTGVEEHTAELGAAASSPASFGVDATGELYVVSYAGAVFRITGTGQPPAPDPGPEDPPPSGGTLRPWSGAPIGTAKPRER
jgi:hypothetical protein